MRDVFQGIRQPVAVGWFHRSSEDGTTCSGQMSFGFFDLLTHMLAAIAQGGEVVWLVCGSANMGVMVSLPVSLAAGTIHA